jgi:hypothetical protein
MGLVSDLQKIALTARCGRDARNPILADAKSNRADLIKWAGKFFL